MVREADLAALDDLKRFEHEADAMVASMPVSRLPARIMMSGLHYFLFQARHAEVLGLAPMPGVAETVAGRLGYMLDLVGSRSGESVDLSARDAIGRFVAADADGGQMAALLDYGHFSELMPEVHKGYYEVRDESGELRLLHRDATFATFQAEDIVLSELALVFPLPHARRIEHDVYRLALDPSNLDPDLLTRTLAAKAERHLRGVAEANLVTEKGMQRIFGFRYVTFYRIRAAVLAFAEFVIDMSVVLGGASTVENGGGRCLGRDARLGVGGSERRPLYSPNRRPLEE
jgi:hypothetical protein